MISSGCLTPGAVYLDISEAAEVFGIGSLEDSEVFSVLTSELDILTMFRGAIRDSRKGVVSCIIVLITDAKRFM